jgi:hypothetical protein
MTTGTTSVFFNKFNHPGEQKMLDNLVVESIKIHGDDMYYLPRRRTSFDDIYYEDDVSVFDTTYQIETYLKTADGFFGQQSFMSQFGLEIRDEIILTIARTRFETEVTSKELEILRPREGDLIYYPLNNKLFYIKFVDDKPFHYQFGTLQMYDVTCELFEYSHEQLNTGIAAIDSLQTDFSLNQYDHALLAEDGSVIFDEKGIPIVAETLDDKQDENDPVTDNDEISEEETTENVIDFSEDNPFGENESGRWG